MVRKLVVTFVAGLVAAPLAGQTPADSTFMLDAAADYLMAVRPDADISTGHPAEGGPKSFCVIADSEFPESRLLRFSSRIRDRVNLPPARCADLSTMIAAISDSVPGYADVEGRPTNLVSLQMGPPTNENFPADFFVTVGVLASQESGWGVECAFSYDELGALKVDGCGVFQV